MKPNYRQAKRQKEIARKVKQERKMQRRAARTSPASKEPEQNTGDTPENSEPSSPAHEA